MSTEAALLRTIRDMPEEDTPRLVYADYLEEEGNGPRAEFIRVQVELSQLPTDDTRRNALEDREHELLAEHECSWLGVNADDMDELENARFVRGFVHEVAASPVFMRGPGNDLCAANPVRRWRVTSGDRGVNFPEDLKEAGQRGWAARLESLDLTGWYSSLGELSGFFGSRSNFERLRDLNLIGRSPLELLAEIVENAPFRDQLTSLRCGQGGWDGGALDVPDFVRALGTACKLQTFGVPASMLLTDAAADLLRARAFDSLTSLDLSGNQIEADAWEAFRTARFRLRELDLSRTQIGATGLDRLLGCASLAGLRVLRVNHCGSTAGNIRALAASALWAQAEELHMQQGTQWNAELAEDEAPAEQEPVSLTPLLTSAGSKNLRVLNLAGNGLRDDGVASLCAAPWAESLTTLDLSQNYLSDAALVEIARCPRFKNLRALHLNFNSPYHQGGASDGEAITDAGLRALADSPNLANLRVLSVSGTRITAAGVEAVLNSPHWRLSELRISQCQLRPDAVSALVESPRLARLVHLDISSNDELNMAYLEPLAECEYLSPLTELHARGLYAENPAVTTALRQRLGHRLRLT